MQYRHTKRFQALLQSALKAMSAGRGYNLVSVIKAAELSCSKSTLHRFKVATLEHYLSIHSTEGDEDVVALENRFLNPSDARQLWEFLTKRGFIDRATEEQKSKNRELFDIRSVANAMFSFYGAHEAQQSHYIKQKIEGNYLCYKRSFRRPGFIVKSRVKIEAYKSEYFSFEDHQRSSGLFEMGGVEADEKSAGFAFLKSNRLWVFALEQSKGQPRVLCFHVPLSRPQSGGDEIIALYGHVMESSQRFGNDEFYSNNIMLVKDYYDRKIWHQNYGEDVIYDDNFHFDIFPYSDQQIKKYGHLTIYRIPTEIKDYIDNGDMFL